MTRLGVGGGPLALFAADALAQAGPDPRVLAPVIVFGGLLALALGAATRMPVRGAPALEVPLVIADLATMHAFDLPSALGGWRESLQNQKKQPPRRKLTRVLS